MSGPTRPISPRQFELTLGCEKARRGYTDLEDAQAAIRLDALFQRLPDELKRRDDADETKKKRQGQAQEAANRRLVAERTLQRRVAVQDCAATGLCSEGITPERGRLPSVRRR